MSEPPTGSTNMDVPVVSQEMAMLSNMLAAYTFIAGWSLEMKHLFRKRDLAKTSSMHISNTDQPERTALVFLGGVCVGLFVTLCAIVFQIHCRTDCHYGNTHRPHHHHHHHHQHQHRSNKHQHQHQQCPRDSNPDNMTLIPAGGRGPSGDNQSEDWDDTADLSARQRRRFERALLSTRVFTSADDLDRSQRLEERERILREIWMNGQPDISTVTQSLNRYY